MIGQVLEQFRKSHLAKNVTFWQTIPEKPAQYRPFPSSLNPQIADLLRDKGIEQLYTHQAQAFELVSSSKDIVVVTPTASGKTLCYNLPVLNHILANPASRALYLFPTKALAQDQVAELMSMGERLGHAIKTYTYDGDTASDARQAIRSAGNIVVTNPDMLHSGILPPSYQVDGLV